MRATRSLLDLALAALSLWAAFYHTPAGALVRVASAHVFGTATTARPLLAYYSAGAEGAQIASEAIVPRAPLAPGAALGAGAAAVVAHLAPAERTAVLARAHLRSGTPEELADAIARLSARHGSREAGVLALFCGADAAEFAVGRAGKDKGIEDLARELPASYERRVSLAGETLTLATAYALAWPVPPWAHVTSPFGIREHPILGGRKLHAGVDLGVPVGTAVHAVAAGIVRRASGDSVSGLALVIDHGSGVSTVYFHNDRLLVHKGDRVERGQIISRSGNTGRSTGPHLHYQLDLPSGPVDPLRFRTFRPPTAERGGTDL
jgi:murein DD-endopeptidase MepM/ murein hydrolase activator NlpD